MQLVEVNKSAQVCMQCTLKQMVNSLPTYANQQTSTDNLIWDSLPISIVYVSVFKD